MYLEGGNKHQNCIWLVKMIVALSMHAFMHICVHASVHSCIYTYIFVGYILMLWRREKHVNPQRKR